MVCFLSHHVPTVLLFLLAFLGQGCAVLASPERSLITANKLAAQGKIDAAKKHYIYAANRGHPVAQYILTYAYNQAYVKEVSLRKLAALQGFEPALKGLVETLLFRAGDPKKADPVLLKTIYDKAFEANPSPYMTVNKEKERDLGRVIEHCAAAGALGEGTGYSANKVQALDDKVRHGWYTYWAYAEYAANTDHFGKRDSRLAAQFICHGSIVPDELISAAIPPKVWQGGETVTFDICDVAMSSYGINFCENRQKRGFVLPGKSGRNKSIKHP